MALLRTIFGGSSKYLFLLRYSGGSTTPTSIDLVSFDTTQRERMDKMGQYYDFNGLKDKWTYDDNIEFDFLWDNSCFYVVSSYPVSKYAFQIMKTSGNLVIMAQPGVTDNADCDYNKGGLLRGMPDEGFTPDTFLLGYYYKKHTGLSVKKLIESKSEYSYYKAKSKYDIYNGGYTSPTSQDLIDESLGNNTGTGVKYSIIWVYKYNSDNSIQTYSASGYKIIKGSETGKVESYIGNGVSLRSLQNNGFGEPLDIASIMLDDSRIRTPYILLQMGLSVLKLPNSNLVSLTHKRELYDSTNSFELELFDEDGSEVESYLIAGYRNVYFKYTDFLNISKAFYGQVYDYDITLNNTSLMITLKGKCNHVKNTTTQFSVPWKELSYLQNNTDEMIDADTTLTEDSKKELKKLRQMYNRLLTAANDWIDDFTGDGWCRSGAFKLDTPSGIIKAICWLNGWNYNKEDIEQTATVSGQITDQISMTDFDYIKQVLIPLSVKYIKVTKDSTSTIDTINGNFYFRFNDEGKVEFKSADLTNTTEVAATLYFNQGTKNNLISFTPTYTGAIVMSGAIGVNAYTVNYLTGDYLTAQPTYDYTLDTRYEYSSYLYVPSLTMSSAESEEDLQKMIDTKTEKAKSLSYTAELSMWGRTDVQPGDYVDVCILLKNGKPHHSNGRYFVRGMTDTITGGKYISTLSLVKNIDNIGNTLANADERNYSTLEDGITVDTTGYMSGGGGTGSFGSGGSGGGGIR